MLELACTQGHAAQVTISCYKLFARSPSVFFQQFLVQRHRRKVPFSSSTLSKWSVFLFMFLSECILY